VKNKRRLMRAAAAVFVVAALAFLIRNVVTAWNDTNGDSLPGVARFVGAGVICGLGLVAGGSAWVVLLAAGRRRDHSTGFLVAQLGKYIPGGVWQVMGQVGFARAAGVSLARATTAFAALAVTQVVAGAMLAAGLAVTWTSAPTVLRIALVGGLASILLLDRRWMVWSVKRIPRASAAHAEEVPGQRRILLASIGSFASLLALGAAYALLLGGVERVDDFALVIFAEVAAWTVGFLAVPIPSGLGVREAVLVAVLRSSYPSSVVIATSVYLRLVVMIVEGALALAALVWRRMDPAVGAERPVQGEETGGTTSSSRCPSPPE
jgi:glycosyltransferase 2 family protein